jgi:hypothetical protein
MKRGYSWEQSPNPRLLNWEMQSDKRSKRGAEAGEKSALIAIIVQCGEPGNHMGEPGDSAGK